MNQTPISDFLPVSVSTLRPAQQAGINLYRKESGEIGFVLYCADDHPIERDDLDRLRQRGVHRLFIESSARESFQDYLRSIVDCEDVAAVGIEAKIGALNDVVRDVLETQFSHGDTDSTVAEATRLGADTADIICHDEFAASDLFRVLHHDYATFTHSTNVAFYAGMLARSLGYDEQEVGLMTTAGLLHDLGKLQIQEKVLCKPGRLTDEEFDAIKKHPTIGFDQLNFRDDLTSGQLMMVYQHHERLDGSGYPVGVPSNDIHDWAKICAVVDVYEALTSYRPYRSPMPRVKAMEILERDSGTAFDQEVLACWRQIINAIWHA